MTVIALSGSGHYEYIDRAFYHVTATTRGPPIRYALPTPIVAAVAGGVYNIWLIISLADFSLVRISFRRQIVRVHCGCHGRLVASADGTDVVVIATDTNTVRCSFVTRTVEHLTISPGSICVFSGPRLLIIDPIIRAVRFLDGPLDFPVVATTAVAAVATATAVAVITVDAVTVFSAAATATFSIPDIRCAIFTPELYVLTASGVLFRCTGAAATIDGQFPAAAVVLTFNRGTFTAIDATRHISSIFIPVNRERPQEHP